ncbi:MAG: hypothetical protein JWQ12_1309 [Glaciihabitans sp.]|nr:hypothetical protein [Glaciihabitans sp.]
MSESNESRMTYGGAVRIAVTIVLLAIALIAFGTVGLNLLAARGSSNATETCADRTPYSLRADGLSIDSSLSLIPFGLTCTYAEDADFGSHRAKVFYDLGSAQALTGVGAIAGVFLTWWAPFLRRGRSATTILTDRGDGGSNADTALPPTS